MKLKNIIHFPKVPQNGYSSLLKVQEQMSNLFDSFMECMPSFGSSSKFPSLNVSETDGSIIIKVELPYLNEDDVSINIHENDIIISGEKENKTKEDCDTCYINEISYGKFSRTISLPFEIDEKRTKASFSNGFLVIKIEKSDKDKKLFKKIPITKEN